MKISDKKRSGTRNPAIIFITTTSYPHGMAATNRLHLHAKGLQEAGASVKILVMDSIESPEGKPKNIQPGGTFEGVSFRYVTGRTTYARSFLRRKVEKYSGLFKCLYYVFSLHEGDVVFFYPYDFLSLLLFRLTTSIKRVFLIFEITEHPYYHHRSMTGFRGILYKLFVRIAFRFYDGIIVISEGIKDFIHTITNGKVPILVIPIVFNPDEFGPHENRLTQNIVFTTGNLTEENGGIHTLISAFASISSEYPDLRFVVAGDNSNVEFKQKVNASIIENNLENRVSLVGYLSREEYLDYLKVSRVNLLAKPPNFHSTYCFPSRLAEFLASGRPVITSNTPVIKQYILDRTHAFLIDTYDVKAYAQIMREVLSHPDLATAVGIKGRMFANDYFDYRIISRKLFEFLRSLENKTPISQ